MLAAAIHAAPAQCAGRQGEQYIVCAETGGDPRFMRDGAPHPGPSSASGAYGLLSSTRVQFGKGCATDRCIAERYAFQRYGGWQQAARFHRNHGWW